MHAVLGTCDEYVHIRIIYERMCTSVCERPCVDAHAQFMICVAKKAYVYAYTVGRARGECCYFTIVDRAYRHAHHCMQEWSYQNQ